MSIVVQRYQAVLAVLAGDPVVEVAGKVGVSRQSVHAWLRRYADEGLAGLQDRSHRPDSCAHQALPQVEALVCELRRHHPKWGSRRIAFELGRNGCPGDVMPSRMTVYRILIRHGLMTPAKRRRGRKDYLRWERDRPMELWQMDIVGGIFLTDGTEAKVVTGVDDHSRFCVIASVVRRATGRAVCLAFAEALFEFGVPEEVLTDNGKQFTARFGNGGEVMFDRICRENGIVHRLTQPATPTTTGKVERFHQRLRRELLDDVALWPDLDSVQAAIDVFRHEYNTDRPHQSLDMAFPATRFRPAEPGVMPLKLPASLTTPGEPALPPVPLLVSAPAVTSWSGDAVEFDRVVPPSGNLQVAGKQFWLGPNQSGITVTFWADTDVIHLLIGGARIKSVRSHLSVADLTGLLRQGGRPAGPPPLPPAEHGDAVEVDRSVNRAGSVSLGQHLVLAAEILGGRRVGIRIEAATLSFFDLDTRHLLRTRPNPLTPADISRLRGVRPAGPPPQPATAAVPVQRRASNSGVVMVVGQKVALGRAHAGKTVTIEVTDTDLTIHTDAGPRTVRRTNDQPIR
ncbi:IS481 family transposase [Couchioplanes azureus]|uniref:IS481 family transposase n=1 Tax=Couchioplanes caeruleus TaxID=56438 RepID=UPI001E5B3A84|nr:IS481 family transposase [Couchioplanes caeruleus]